MRRLVIFGQVCAKTYKAIRIWVLSQGELTLNPKYLGEHFGFDPTIEEYYLLNEQEVINNILLETV